MPADLNRLPPVLTRLLSGKHFPTIRAPGYARMSGLKWLYAPTPEALAFAVRTTVAALMALTSPCGWNWMTRHGRR